MTVLPIDLDRVARTPLATQIYRVFRDAIETGRLDPGAKLPSWRDMAAQLGVSRGTVRVAYQRLIDEQFAVGAGAAGTRVARRRSLSSPHVSSPDLAPLPELFQTYGTPPLPFQMGVPSQDAFPFKLWSRVVARAARRAAAAPVSYPDPRGDPQLRKEIAAYLGIARGLRCSPAQVFVTGGYSGALGLAVRALQVEGSRALIEDPSFPITRKALDLAGITATAVPVDAEGLDVACAIQSAQDAALAIITPGQHAPLGMTMSLSRRLALLAWARRSDAWIIEDDYLSELQLTGRAAPALASLDHAGRVLHVGSFSKTISPALRLGFVVAPVGMTGRFGDVCACLAPAPGLALQGAVAEFLREGHYIRHLRRMKRLYASRRQAVLDGLAQVGSKSLKVEATAGLAVIVSTTASMSDAEIAGRARSFGLAPSPLSQWYVRSPLSQGLLLGVTNLDTRRLAQYCRQLAEAAQ
ncbi:PLP-dependent aminotransferase family protein [Mesorhizobium atlanticum]|uniref:PLP-dependent aminotransferase family protein n=1 Tax=Mesorhizobium atlanticum TaxID=2233532 RepID=A0A330GXZ5_9HYPH|nr:PLP-dependent aminotransferase family protein [Mesorhizobium atlanticum]RAZ80065.1 PLP-dependent aminotransferase family protein [Mesorhizobium atlanticum]